MSRGKNCDNLSCPEREDGGEIGCQKERMGRDRQLEREGGGEIGRECASILCGEHIIIVVHCCRGTFAIWISEPRRFLFPETIHPIPGKTHPVPGRSLQFP